MISTISFKEHKLVVLPPDLQNTSVCLVTYILYFLCLLVRAKAFPPAYWLGCVPGWRLVHTSWHGRACMSVSVFDAKYLGNYG